MAQRIDLTNTKRIKKTASKFEKVISNELDPQPKHTLKYYFKKFLKIVFYLWIASVVAILLLKFIPVYFTPTMIVRKIDALKNGENSKIYSEWTPYHEIDKNCALAVIASEDQRFPTHNGFDFEALQGALKNNLRGKKIKGASTISQQVAKNVFLWQDRSYIRKGLEVYFTFMIELIWGKERILEVYLNVAETGKMTFGVEAACRRYYNHSSLEVSKSEAARIAAVLPNPIRFSIENPSNYVLRRTSNIQRQMRMLGGKSYLDQLK
ncbi:MAG: monofunctional biosynthetic peptidoglycan transglycosylase [Aquirufa sp.]